MEPDERLLTVPEVARTLSVSQDSVRRWLREGTLPGFRLGSDRAGWRVRWSDLVALLQRLDQETQSQRESRAQYLARQARRREHEQAPGQEPGRPLRVRGQKPHETRNTRHARTADDAAHPETGDVPEHEQEETA